MGSVRTAAWYTQIQKALELCSADCKVERTYTGKTCKATVSNMSCWSGIIIGAWQEVRIVGSVMTVQLWGGDNLETTEF